MNVEFIFTAQCPKCGNRAFQQPARLDLESDLTCPKCGHLDKLGKFADSATVDRVLEIGKQTAREAFKNVRGFKPHS